MDTPRGVWEELDLGGRPLPMLPKRLRVQARQVHVFATGATAGFGARYRERAEDVFTFLVGRGFDPATGRFARLIAPDGTVHGTQDLYDVAFVLLALAALARAGATDLVTEWLPRWEAALAAHRAPEGWFETPGPTPGFLPRRQNPHMHLFEASLAALEATGEPQFAAIAEECLGLFRDRFFDSATGLVLEYFEADWTPLPPVEQMVEPGHMAEWVALLADYTRVTGRAHGIDLRALFDRAYATGAPDGGPFICDAVPLVGESTETRRFWPQTELLRASLVLKAAGERLPHGLVPEELLAGLFTSYLATPVAGGWHDRFSIRHELLSASMPASTLYHVFGALRLGLCR